MAGSCFVALVLRVHTNPPCIMSTLSTTNTPSSGATDAAESPSTDRVPNRWLSLARSTAGRVEASSASRDCAVDMWLRAVFCDTFFRAFYDALGDHNRAPSICIPPESWAHHANGQILLLQDVLHVLLHSVNQLHPTLLLSSLRLFDVQSCYCWLLWAVVCHIEEDLCGGIGVVVGQVYCTKMQCFGGE